MDGVLCAPESIAALAERFVGRGDAYARQTPTGYLAVRAPLTRALLARHLRGLETLALYPLLPDATTRLVCWDFDRAGCPEALQGPVTALRRALARRGIPSALEDSGRKGYHVWVFLTAPLAAATAIAAALAAFRRAGLDRHAAEVFPRQPWARDLGNCIKLPWGSHRVSHRPCLLLDPDFRPVPDQLAALAAAAPVPPTVLAALCLEPPDVGVNGVRPRPDPRPASGNPSPLWLAGSSLPRGEGYPPHPREDPLSPGERARVRARLLRPSQPELRRPAIVGDLGDLGEVGQPPEGGRPPFPANPLQLPSAVHRLPPTVHSPSNVLLAPCILRMFEGVNEGARDVAAFSLAKHFLRAGLPAPVARAAVRAWNTRNHPPLPRAQVDAKVASAYTHGYRAYGCEDPIVGRFCAADCPLFFLKEG